MSTGATPPDLASIAREVNRALVPEARRPRTVFLAAVIAALVAMLAFLVMTLMSFTGPGPLASSAGRTAAVALALVALALCLVALVASLKVRTLQQRAVEAAQQEAVARFAASHQGYGR